MRRRRGGRPPPRPCRRSRRPGPGSTGRRRRAGRRSGARGPSISSFVEHDSKARRGGGALRVGGQLARVAARRARCRGSSRRAARPSRPRACRRPTPRRCRRAARRRTAPRRRGARAPAPSSPTRPRRSCSARGRTCGPTATCASPRGGRPLGAGRQPPAGPRAERDRVGAGDEDDGMVGELRVAGPRMVRAEARERGVRDREAADQDAGDRRRRRRRRGGSREGGSARRRRRRRSGTSGREAEPRRDLLTRAEHSSPDPSTRGPQVARLSRRCSPARRWGHPAGAHVPPACERLPCAPSDDPCCHRVMRATWRPRVHRPVIERSRSASRSGTGGSAPRARATPSAHSPSPPRRRRGSGRDGHAVVLVGAVGLPDHVAVRA